MATNADQLAFDVGLPASPPSTEAKPPKIFAGLSRGQILVGALLLCAAIWAMWATREIIQLRAHKVVSVRLGEIVNQFALAEARSGDDADKVTARTRAFMQALDKALKARAAEGTVVLVGEAVVASSGEDITAAVAADVTRLVPMPVAQAMPPRLPLGVAPSGAAPAGGVAQAMLGAFGPGSGQGGQPAPFGPSQGAAGPGGAYPQGAGDPQAAADPSAYQGGGDAQP